MLAEFGRRLGAGEEAESGERASGGPRLGRFGDYELLEVVASGGMGVVYRAKQTRLGRIVALKMIRGGARATEQETSRFHFEAEAAAKLDHPGIVPIYEVGEVDGLRFYSMAFVEGQSLAQTVSTGPLTADRAARLVRQIAEAVAYAHSRGIIHRDLKPANILIDAAGQPRVTDFGLAKRADSDSDLTKSGQVMGTPSYMPPEQAEAKGESIGARSDVYSLGATLYCLLTGRPPFQGATSLETLKQVVELEPIPPRQLNAPVGRDLDTICLKCLEKRPERRYSSVRELADELGRVVDGRPILARPVGLPERASRWFRRRPAIAALIAAILLVAVTGVAGVIWQWREAVAAKNRAEASTVQERWERYRANVASAASALQLNNGNAARRSLEAAPVEHRKWEWDHLASQLDGSTAILRVPIGRFVATHPKSERVAICPKNVSEIGLWDARSGKRVKTLVGHSAPISPTALAYSPDGTRLASGSMDHTIRLWDAATGEPVAVLRGHENPVVWLGFGANGARIASLAAGENTIRLWDGSTGREIAVLSGHTRPPSQASFTPDGQRLVSGSHLEGTIRVWDATTGAASFALQGATQAVSPDGKWIASFRPADSSLYLWDGLTGRPVAVLKGNSMAIRGASFSPDSRRVVSFYEYPDKTGKLWDLSSLKEIAALSGHRNYIDTAEFSPDGTRLVTATEQTAWLWDGVTGKPIATLRGHTGGVRQASFSPDGSRVLTASRDQTLRLWDSSTGASISILRGHDGIVSNFWFIANEQLLLSSAEDNTLRVWDTGLVERNGVVRGHESFVYDVAFRPDGTTIASSGWDQTARLFDATTGRQIVVLTLEKQIVLSLAFHTDGRHFLTVTRPDCVQLWDLETRCASQPLRGVAGVTSDSRAAFHPDGKRFAVACDDGTARLWEIGKDEPVAVFRGHALPAVDVAFRPDGAQLASAGRDGNVRLWDLATGDSVAILGGHEDFVQRIVYSADGRLLASGSMDKTVRLWDSRTYREVAVWEVGSSVYGLSFSPEGTRLAAGCADNTVRLWDVAHRAEVVELRGHDMYVHSVAFSPDGSRLASGSGDATLRIWDSLSVQQRARAKGSPEDQRANRTLPTFLPDPSSHR
jgi:WD40 repeat protein